MLNFLNVVSWIGLITNVIGAHYQSKLEMRRAFRWFIVANCLLIGIQVAMHIWSQALLLAIFFYMNVKGLRHLHRVQQSSDRCNT